MLTLRPLEQIDEAVLRFLVDRGEGFVEEKHRRFHDEGAGKGDTLAFAAGEPGRETVEQREDADALRRTLLDRLGVHAEIVGPSAASAHDYDTYVVELAVLRVRLHERPRALKVQDFAWVRPEAFDRYEFPPADRGTVSRLLGLDSGVAEGD